MAQTALIYRKSHDWQSDLYKHSVWKTVSESNVLVQLATKCATRFTSVTRFFIIRKPLLSQYVRVSERFHFLHCNVTLPKNTLHVTKCSLSKSLLLFNKTSTQYQKFLISVVSHEEMWLCWSIKWKLHNFAQLSLRTPITWA